MQRDAQQTSGISRGAGERGQTAPGDTLQGVTPKQKNLWVNLQKLWTNEVGQVKNVWGDTLQEGDT